MSAAEDVRGAIETELAAMSGAWIAATREAEALGAQGAVLAKVLGDYRQRLGRYGSAFPAGRPANGVPAASLGRGVVLLDRYGNWVVAERVIERLNTHLNRAQRAAAESSQRRFTGGRQRDEARRHAEDVAAVLRGLAAEADRVAHEREDVLARRAVEARELREAGERRLAEAVARLKGVMTRLPPAMTPWSSSSWRSWEPGFSHSHVLLGMLQPRGGQAGSNNSFGWDARTPVFVPAREAVELQHRHGDRVSVHALARSLLLRALACTPPGKLRLSVFDPAGLGQSVASLLELGEYDRELIGGKVWSSGEDLRRLLAEHTSHIELVIQKYLRAEYATLDEFNAAAGAIAEPYRLLVIFDAPTGFDERSAAELRRILENGPRCGVGTLLVTDTDVQPPYGVSFDGLAQGATTIMLAEPIGGGGVTFDLIPETDEHAPDGVVASIIDQVGRSAQTMTSSAVTFEAAFGLFVEAAMEARKRGLPRLGASVETEDPATWWTQTTVESVAAPIGLRGARDVATLALDSADHAGALLVGRPGSGKSTLLHTFIAGITTLYGPQELDLHLIDFKEGVEFKVYAARGLPHARSVAIESDREFGVSVLQAIQAELSWRASLLRGSAGYHASLASLRQATGERLPRIVLIFDEFQVLFARNDKLGAAAAEALETLIRQGRGFGIHVLLGSQSLAGLDALGSHVPQLLPVRILLPAAEGDAFKVLGEGNTEGGALTTAGEGILNMAGGAIEANERFRGAVTGEDVRRERVVRMRAKADAAGFHRRPVVFEGNAPIPAQDTPPAQFADEVRGADARTLRLRFGAPMAIAGSADIDLRREAGANVVLVARDAGSGDGAPAAVRLPRAVTANLTLSAVARGAAVEVADFLPIEEGLDAPLAPLVEAGVVTLSRRRQVPALLERLRAEIDRRVNEDDTTGRATLLVLYGMQRARDFDVDAVDYDAAADLPALLGTILRDGPEVGVHTYLWFDTVASIGRRLAPGAVREISWRLAGRMSADDSASLVAADSAASLREQQLLAANEDRGVLRRCTTIDEPPVDWIRDLLSVIAAKRTRTIE